mmetsp:Transcript_15257/g.50631  ORF Transcript_15257/g.50631 Transcript_15257/m.50631 type:complete len:181 (+) Transcript_15257:1046-1588(+)
MLERQQKESAGGGSGGGEGEELLEMELAKAHSTAQPERVRKEKKAKRLSRQEIDGMGLRQLKAALKERGYSEAATKFSNLPDEAKKLREFAKSKSAICLQPTAELEREEDAVLAAALAEKKGLLERLTDKVEEMVYGSARDPAKEAQAARKKKIKELKQDREKERQKQREKERELLYGVE